MGGWGKVYRIYGIGISREYMARVCSGSDYKNPGEEHDGHPNSPFSHNTHQRAKNHKPKPKWKGKGDKKGFVD